MSLYSDCYECGRHLTQDEMGLYRKMVNRGAKNFLCISCLSVRFSCDEESLREKIAYFRKNGCTLFPTESTGVAAKTDTSEKKRSEE